MLKDLYLGKVTPWERQVIQKEDSAVTVEIEKEQQYFLSKMPPDDGQRFEKFMRLCASQADEEEAEAFSRGFILAARWMIEVFGG